MSPQICSAGHWFLESGIQEVNGGVARYYRADLERNNPVSTEITGYAASALVYLHSLSQDPRYLDRATAAARFLACIAWDRAARIMPFELDPARFTYFFDCGIVTRGLLAVWRATGTDEFLECAVQVGEAMLREFPAGGGEVHPILSLPELQPEVHDPLRWSRAPGCYQLKSAMAWWDLAEATGESRFTAPYDQALEAALAGAPAFLPGHPDPHKVMDRLHPYLYFLEGLLPRAADPRCAGALRHGIAIAARYLRELAPEFERSDVYAQLLRIRMYADGAGAAPLDQGAAAEEARQLAAFQGASPDRRVHGGFWFGRRGAEFLPHSNPVSTAFALQALALFEGAGLPQRHLLI